MPVKKPSQVANDPIRTTLWDQLTNESNLATKDAPFLSLLCLWYAIAAEAETELTNKDGRLEVLDPIGIKPFKDQDGEPVFMYRKTPALAVLKEASAEIRALSEQLGLTSRTKAETKKQATTPNGKLLNLVFTDRSAKEQKAANQ